MAGEKRVERKTELGDRGVGRTVVKGVLGQCLREAPACCSPVMSELLEGKT